MGAQLKRPLKIKVRIGDSSFTWVLKRGAGDGNRTHAVILGTLPRSQKLNRGSADLGRRRSSDRELPRLLVDPCPNGHAAGTPGGRCGGQDLGMLTRAQRCRACRAKGRRWLRKSRADSERRI